jgi:ribosome recycling factor
MSYDFSTFETDSKKAIEHIRQDVNTLRTGRATVQMLDSVTVEAYGSYMKLIEVASVQAPDPTLLVVTPWDKSLLEATQKGIKAANLNLNPIVDGGLIRISVPPLTEEKRHEMVKQLQRKIEDGKVMLRNVRSDSKQEIDDQKGQDGVSEDDIGYNLEELDRRHKSYLDILEKMSETKEKELLTI